MFFVTIAVKLFYRYSRNLSYIFFLRDKYVIYRNSKKFDPLNYSQSVLFVSNKMCLFIKKTQSFYLYKKGRYESIDLSHGFIDYSPRSSQFSKGRWQRKNKANTPFRSN